MSTNRVLHYTNDGVSIYHPTSDTQRSNRRNLVQRKQGIPKCGKVCSVQEIPHNQEIIVSIAADPVQKVLPLCFLGILIEWGYTWMWEALKVVGDDNWLEQVIEEGSCFTLTDGSYYYYYHFDLFR